MQSRADIVVIFDTVQYSRRHWYNRNLIATANGPQWITVPVNAKGNYCGLIKNIQISSDLKWKDRIIRSVQHSYSSAPYFEQYFAEFEALIRQDWQNISDLSFASIRWGFEKLGKSPTFVLASELDIEEGDPVSRLIKLCQAVGARHYISGPAAKDYIGSGEKFKEADIDIEWINYEYEKYPQINCTQDVEMSILDLLFNVGPAAGKYIWS